MGSKVGVLAGSSGSEGAKALEMHWKSLYGRASVLEKAGARQRTFGLDLQVYGGPCFSGKPLRNSSCLHKRASPADVV